MRQTRGLSGLRLVSRSIAALAAVSTVAAIGFRTDGAVAASRPKAAAGDEVTARSFWEATLSGLDCIRSHGYRSVGPFPAADGINVQYSVEVGISDEDRAAQGRCLEGTVALAARFAAVNGSPAEVELGQDPGQPPSVSVAPAETEEGRRLLEIRASLVHCLGLRGDESDAHLTRLAHDEGDRFDHCVESLR